MRFIRRNVHAALQNRVGTRCCGKYDVDIMLHANAIFGLYREYV